MKILSAIPALFLAVSGTFAHENTTLMRNGAELTVDINDPVRGSPRQIDMNKTSEDVLVKGKAHVGQGDADVAYIYVIDTSGSTDNFDGACGTTLECVRDFFLEFNKAVIADGSAKMVSVINFDDYAYISADWMDPTDPFIEDAIMDSNSTGGTWCSHALEMAAGLVLHPDNTANTTVVVFAGDGMCNGDLDWGDNVESVGEDVTESASMLAATGAIVHSIAVGDEVDCDDFNDLHLIPQNGGDCYSIPDPSSLPSGSLIKDIIGTNLTSLELMVDGNMIPNANFEYSQGMNSSSVMLPLPGDVSIDFETVVTGLMEGPHEICVIATGHDSPDDPFQVTDCHKFEVTPPPPATVPLKPALEDERKTEAPAGWVDGELEGGGGSSGVAAWQVALAVVGSLSAALVIVVLVGRKSKGATRDETEARPSTYNNPDSMVV